MYYYVIFWTSKRSLKVIKMKMTKKANLDVTKYVSVIVGVIVLFIVVAALLPTAITSGNSLNTSLGGTGIALLFASGGAIWTILAVGILIAVIYALMPKKR